MNGVVEAGQGTDEEFAGFVVGLAQDVAPRLFAIVEEYGEREDAEVAAYGLAFADHADVNSVEGDFRLRSQSRKARWRSTATAPAPGTCVGCTWCGWTERSR